MNEEKLNTVKEAVENAYVHVNELVKYHGFDMIDLAYPMNDGEQDAEVGADMIMLRQSAKELSIACNELVGMLTNVIGDAIEIELDKTGYRYQSNEDGSYDVCYDHNQDNYFNGINMYHVATIKDDNELWYINNHAGAGWGEYPKKDWTLKDAIYDQCINEHEN